MERNGSKIMLNLKEKIFFRKNKKMIVVLQVTSKGIVGVHKNNSGPKKSQILMLYRLLLLKSNKMI